MQKYSDFNFLVNPGRVSNSASIEPRHPRARRDIEAVRFLVDELLFPSELIEFLIERQLAVYSMCSLK